MNSFIRDLIVWIEKNLDKKILLEDVAVKSGYSKWYFQRLFRHETGMKLATYIRQRRLSEAALLLKMTSVPVISAAEQCGFSNQQAFTRTFTRHFSMPPARYRQSEEWHFYGLQPSLLSVSRRAYKPEIIKLTTAVFSDITFSYLCDQVKLSSIAYHTEQRMLGLKKASRFLPCGASIWFTENFEPAESSGKIRFTLTFGFYEHQDFITGAGPDKFLRFPFEGSSAELTELQMNIYQHVLPSRKEARRNGPDLFITRPFQDKNPLSPRFQGEYYLPIT